MDKQMQLEFEAENTKVFSRWLKRFSLIDENLLLELDSTNLKFIAKAYNEVRSVVKMSDISFNEINFDLKSKPCEQRIKIGIFSISKFIKIVENFTGKFSIIFYFEKLINSETNDVACTKIVIKNDDLKINVDCTSLSVFKYISDDLFINTIADSDNNISFDLTLDSIEKINSLCDIDKDYKFIDVCNDNGKIFIKNKTFELILGITNNNDTNISLYKDQFYKLDKEAYHIKSGEDRLIFNSIESNTITVLSAVNKDE